MQPADTTKVKATVQVEKLVYGGDALARLNGQVVLMPFVLPGEQVRIEPRRAKGDLLRAGNIEVLQASSHRVKPGCEYFGSCGGCQYQHAGYDYQLEQKRAILRETLRRIGGVTFEGEIQAISADPWQYRNRIQLHFDGDAVGFRFADSHTVCSITHCPISSPKINQIIDSLVAAVKKPEWPSFLRSLEVFTDETAVQLYVVESNRPVAVRFFQWMTDIIPGCVTGALNYEAAGHPYRISRGSFFQVNRFLIDALVNETLRDFHGNSAVDLYAGVGLFTRPLADRFQHVEAVERGSPAYRDLEWNTADRQERVSAVKADAEAYLRQCQTKPDLIIADPPRAGLGRDAVQQLVRIAAPRITVVSCDPATLARDLKALLEAYVVDRLTLIDLFPQTFHFETVVHLSAKN